MRRVARVILVLGLTSGLVPTNDLPGRAGLLDAQKASVVSPVIIRLASQDAWNSVDRPLRLSFDATNTTGLPMDELSVGLSIQTPATSRSLFELSVTQDLPVTLFGYSYPQDGALQPRQTRRFEIEQDVGTLSSRADSALYPLKVELRSHDVPVATMRTPMVFLFEDPQVPLNLTWTWVLAAPVEYRPDGTFLPGTLEADIAPGGRLRSMAIALARLRGHQVDVVASAALIEELTRMADGYDIIDVGGVVRTVPKGEGGSGDAQAMLELLREVAGRSGTELMTTPLGDPNLPAVFGAGLSSDLDGLFDRGTDLVRSALDRAPVGDVFRPPVSRLDAATLGKLAVRRIRTVLLDPGFIRFERFTAPDVVHLTPAAPVSASGSLSSPSVAAVLPDPDINRLIQGQADDPRLAAHQALGALAANWFELPGTPGRGAALLFPAGDGLGSNATSPPPAFFRPFAALVRQSPWLDTLTATGFVSIAGDQPLRPIPPKNYHRFPVTYVADLLSARAALRQYGATVPGTEAKQRELADLLLAAEAGTFVDDPTRGHAFLDRVQAEIGRAYAGVRISTSVVTLASQSGQFPLEVRNDSGHELRVVLKLVADRRIEFVGGPLRTIALAPGTKTLLLLAKARATGRIPVRVQVLTSGGGPRPDVIAERTMVIRSTAYNRVALFVTIGAALFLLGWWGRRFLPRRRRA